MPIMEENGEPVEVADPPKKPRAPRASKAGVRTKQPNGDIIEVDGVELDAAGEAFQVEQEHAGFTGAADDAVEVVVGHDATAVRSAQLRQPPRMCR